MNNTSFELVDTTYSSNVQRPSNSNSAPKRTFIEQTGSSVKVFDERGDNNSGVKINNETTRSLSALSDKIALQKYPDTIGILCCTITVYSLLCTFMLLGFLLQVLSWVLLWPIFILAKKNLLGNTGRHIADIPSKIWKTAQVLCFVCNPFWRLKAVNTPPPSWDHRSVLFMVNHQSSLDGWITATALFPWFTKYVYKKSLEDIPIVGWGVKMSDELDIKYLNQGGGWKVDPVSVKDMMRRAKELIDLGMSILVFPEGTRANDPTRLQPFKPGFFRFSVEHNVEIMPVVLHKTKHLWPSMLRCVPGTCYVHFGTPIQPRENMPVEELMNQVQEHMVEMQCEFFELSPDELKPLTSFKKIRGKTVY